MTSTARGPEPVQGTGNALPFPRLFLLVLRFRPLRALGALYWHVTRRRVRARNWLLAAAAGSTEAYKSWIIAVEREDVALGAAPEQIGAMLRRPLFSVIPTRVDAVAIRNLAATLLEQCYSEWELVIPEATAHEAADIAPERIRLVCKKGTDRPFGAAVAQARGEWILPVPPGMLAPTALMRYAQAAIREPSAIAIYADEDCLSPAGKRLHPWFKPEWNGELFLAQDYLSAACAIDRSAACIALDNDSSIGSPEALLVALLVDTDRPVVHIPAICTHVIGPAAVEAVERAKVVDHYLSDRGARAEPGPFGSVRIRWPAPAPAPQVTLIVPTRDKAELLRACIESVTAQTTYPAYDILVVDNDSQEPETLAYLNEIDSRPDIHVLRWPHPYNYAAINNEAARTARGSFLCLLNNDTEVVDGGWLDEMMRYAVRPEVGAVGAKLLYDDGSIQHAGVVIGLGQAAGHAHRHLPRGEAGYFARAHIPHYVSAVTAACLVVEKAKFEAVGGLDADNLAVAFNDVDLCLKLQERGWRNVYAAHAVLIHHESKSRGNDLLPANRKRYFSELAVLQARWGTRDYRDPLHHPALDRGGETYAMKL